MAYDPTDDIFAELERNAAERAERAGPPVDPVAAGGQLPPERLAADRARRAAEEAEQAAEDNQFNIEAATYGYTQALINQSIRRRNRGLELLTLPHFLLRAHQMALGGVVASPAYNPGKQERLRLAMHSSGGRSRRKRTKLGALSPGSCRGASRSPR